MKAIDTKKNKISNTGIFVAIGIIVSWLAFITFAFSYETTLWNPWNIPIVLVLMHLYTGLFITSHDAMHHTVSSNPKVNDFIGRLCVILYACFSYTKLKYEHHSHHKHVATEDDPDFYDGNFFLWFAQFMKNYMALRQLVSLAILYNLIHLIFGVPKLNLTLFWVVPPLLSSLQLFYFGTYLPHKNPQEINNKYKSRTQPRNFFVGFITCYFFGYHYEHHSKPFLPWWKLWKEKLPQQL
jgi:beta-carotene ketolase (CrtW type)